VVATGADVCGVSVGAAVWISVGEAVEYDGQLAHVTGHASLELICVPPGPIVPIFSHRLLSGLLATQLQSITLPLLLVQNQMEESTHSGGLGAGVVAGTGAGVTGTGAGVAETGADVTGTGAGVAGAGVTGKGAEVAGSGS
jgi:hypothetical protein